MSNLIFPTGITIFEKKAFSREYLQQTLSEIRGQKDFTGYLTVTSESLQRLLFFLQGEPYAAGKTEGNRSVNLTLADFFADLPEGSRPISLLSLFKTDPVLMKGMLVFLQKEPTIKAGTGMIDMDKVLLQIRERPSALIVLKKEEQMNFFFFLKGKAVMSHFAVSEETTHNDLSVAEQLILYAYQGDISAPVDALIYFDLATSPAADSGKVPADIVLSALDNAKKTHGRRGPLRRISLSVIAGPDLGKAFVVDVPCIVGRKEGGIILHDAKVSGKHAVITESDGKMLVEDMDSTNGTYVDGIRVRTRQIVEGTVVTLGETQLKVEEIVPALG